MEIEPQREPLAEIQLQGGQLTPGIVRVGKYRAQAIEGKCCVRSQPAALA